MIGVRAASPLFVVGQSVSQATMNGLVAERLVGSYYIVAMLDTDAAATADAMIRRRRY